MAAEKTIALITGANGGIGFEVALQLLSDVSYHVLLGSRSIEKGGAAVKDLQSRHLSGTVELAQLYVSSEESITAAARSVESRHGRLDALVNNAGIAGGNVPGPVARQAAVSFQTNATGPLLVGEAFAPLLKNSTGTPRIVNISSCLGSIAARVETTREVTACQAVEYGESGFKVFAYEPGFVVSNFGPHNKIENGAKPTSEGAAPVVALVQGERDAEHATFVHAAGHYPW